MKLAVKYFIFLFTCFVFSLEINAQVSAYSSFLQYQNVGDYNSVDTIGRTQNILHDYNQSRLLNAITDIINEIKDLPLNETQRNNISQKIIHLSNYISNVNLIDNSTTTRAINYIYDVTKKAIEEEINKEKAAKAPEKIHFQCKLQTFN